MFNMSDGRISTRFDTSAEISFSSQQQQPIMNDQNEITFSTASTLNLEISAHFGDSFGQQQTGLFAPYPHAYGTSTTENESSFTSGSSQEGFSSMQTNPSLSAEFGFRNDFAAHSFIQGGSTSTFGQTSILMQASSRSYIFLRNSKQAKSTQDHVLVPRNPTVQKSVPAQTSHRNRSKNIKPKSIYMYKGLRGSKSQLFDGLDDDDSDTIVPCKNVKKLTIKKPGEKDSSITSRVASIATESSSPQMEPATIQHSTFISRGTPDHITQQNVEEERLDTENTIHSKEFPDPISDTPNKDVDDLLNARNKGMSQLPSLKLQDMSVLSQSNASENDVMEERPTTPPPPHPAGIVLRRPGYFTVPNLEELAELVDENGDCFVEDFTIARDGYGSIYFPGVTNVANLNLDDIVFFRRKEVVVYPDDDNKPPVGEGLNKKAEITLDHVWPKDESVGTPIKDAEKLKAMKWQDKLEEYAFKNGTEFLDYRSETGSWVFKVKHFSKYGLLDDSDFEDLSEQE